MKHLFIFGFLLTFNFVTEAQNNKDTTKKFNSNGNVVIGSDIYEGDTIAVYLLKRFTPKESISAAEKRENDSLVRSVRKVLPYAKLAAFRLQMMEDNLKLIISEKAKKRYIKECEKSIKKQFMDDLKNLYDYQGRMLLKLIHRETGKSSWEIMKNYTGSFETFFWQAIAKTYNASMKETYDPIVDYKIEQIIKSIEAENAPQN